MDNWLAFWIGLAVIGFLGALFEGTADQ